MGKTVDRMLKSAGLDTKTGISTVEGDEDHNLTVTIALPAVLLICLLPLSMMSVEGIDMPICLHQWCCHLLVVFLPLLIASLGAQLKHLMLQGFGSAKIRQTKLRYTFISIMKSN